MFSFIMEYIIRPCDPKELSEVVRLCELHAAYEKASYSAEGKADLLAKAIFSDTPALHCFVVVSGGGIVGYFTYTFDFSTWEARRFLYLDCLYLDENHRGRGVGRLVFQTLISRATEAQCANMQWQTPIWNEMAIKFYKKTGATAKEKARFTFDLTNFY